MNKNLDLGLLLLRLTIGGLMLFHGIAKLVNGIGGLQGLFSSKGLPEFLVYGVYLGEVVAPILIIIGFRTRLSAIVLALTMLVAILIAHPNDILSLTEHGGWGVELAGLYLFGSLALFYTGGGNYALSSAYKWD